MSKQIKLDGLVGVNPRPVGRAVMRQLTALQDFTPEQQAIAAGVLFVLLIRHYGVHASMVLDVAHNVLEKELHTVPEIGAAVRYTENEL